MTNVNKQIHSVRNPLNSISMNAELGRLTLENTQDIEKAIKVFDAIIRECQTCGEALTQLRLAIGESSEDGE